MPFWSALNHSTGPKVRGRGSRRRGILARHFNGTKVDSGIELVLAPIDEYHGIGFLLLRFWGRGGAGSLFLGAFVEIPLEVFHLHERFDVLDQSLSVLFLDVFSHHSERGQFFQGGGHLGGEGGHCGVAHDVPVWMGREVVREAR